MSHYSPWPIGIRGGALGINYDGNVYLLADGRLILQSGGGLTLSSTSDISMSGGAINMTGGSINLDSGSNYIHMSTSEMTINAIDILLKEGNLMSQAGADGYTYFMTTENGEMTAVGNGGAGFLTYRLAENLYQAYMGCIDATNTWKGYMMISPGNGSNVDPYTTIYSDGEIDIVPGAGKALNLGWDDNTSVKIGGTYPVWSDGYHPVSTSKREYKNTTITNGGASTNVDFDLGAAYSRAHVKVQSVGNVRCWADIMCTTTSSETMCSYTDATDSYGTKMIDRTNNGYVTADVANFNPFSSAYYHIYAKECYLTGNNLRLVLGCTDTSNRPINATFHIQAWK